MIRTLGTALFLSLFTFATASAQPSHGIAMHGDLKYPADFKHFDYVNPNAPKGGEVKRWARGGYDTFNPYVVRGRAGAGISSMRS